MSGMRRQADFVHCINPMRADPYLRRARSVPRLFVDVVVKIARLKDSLTDVQTKEDKRCEIGSWVQHHRSHAK